MGTATNDTIRDLIVDIRFTRRLIAANQRLGENRRYLACCIRQLHKVVRSKYENGGTAPTDRYGWPIVLSEDIARAK